MCQPGFMRNESAIGTEAPSPTASTAAINRTAPCAVSAQGEAAEGSPAAVPTGLAIAAAAISRATTNLLHITPCVSGVCDGCDGCDGTTVVWARSGLAGKAN